MLKPATHFDQVPMHEIIDVVKKELEKQTVEPKRSGKNLAQNADLRKKSDAPTKGEQK